MFQRRTFRIVFFASWLNGIAMFTANIGFGSFQAICLCSFRGRLVPLMVCLGQVRRYKFTARRAVCLRALANPLFRAFRLASGRCYRLYLISFALFIILCFWIELMALL